MPDNDNESVKRTLRERKFIEAYIASNGNATESYLTISPKVTRDSARELGKRMVAKVGLSIIELLDEMGLTDPVISQALIDGLDATKYEGQGENRREVTDHTSITKYLDMILKLKASYPADRSKLELTGKDGQPLQQSSLNFVIVQSYKNCPLKDTRGCPMEKEVNQLENSKEKENEQKNDEN